MAADCSSETLNKSPVFAYGHKWKFPSRKSSFSRFSAKIHVAPDKNLEKIFLSPRINI